MRLSRMLLIAVLAVLASLTMGASPVLAQSTATVLPTVCQERVCLTVTVESSTEVYVMARVHHPVTSCGHFVASLEAAGRVVTAASNISCVSPPVWCSAIFKPAGSGSVKVRFVSDPATPGEPVVFF